MDLLTSNAAQGAARTTDDDAALYDSYSARARAVASLLIELPPEEREGLSAVIDLASPGRRDTREKVLALQDVLMGWTAGEIAPEDALKTYRAALGRRKTTLQG
ncbi:hypothetical protein J7E68_15190 [Microbacterium sp. ISL-103]|uniref:hypothetical protein n=1 Tax=Microbacterium sp. ISL-103 TaxID=2819156 RepID=UPI001BE8FD84|nr:hypothetical protein [Microbacterium sp. ISL-103]MBT2475882.1 hypothetical protein [Microbacterium sp. ISL-103]